MPKTDTPTNRDFTAIMFEKTDRQLIDILSVKKEEYQEEALVAAQHELDKRKLSIADVYSEEDIIHAQYTETVHRQEKGLDKYLKFLTVALPILVSIILSWLAKTNPDLNSLRYCSFGIVIGIQYIIHKLLKDNGYIRMAEDFKNWVIYTYYIYIGLVILLGIVVFIHPN